MAGTFSAKVSAWAAKSKDRMVAVRNTAVERVVEIAQTPIAAGGALPVDTGFLRASLQATTGAAVPAKRGKPGQGGAFSYDPGDLTLVLAGATLDDVITIAWTADYARHVEYGARGRPGRAFMRLAAQQWPRAVSEASAGVEASVRNRRGG
jgi:hypothetical protein